MSLLAGHDLAMRVIAGGEVIIRLVPASSSAG